MSRGADTPPTNMLSAIDCGRDVPSRDEAAIIIFLSLLFATEKRRWLILPSCRCERRGPRMSDAPHSADLRKGRFSDCGAAYLVTKCRVEGLRLPLSQMPQAALIVQAIRWHQERHYLHLLAFVVMPDHIHWLFVLGGERSLPQVMKGFASVTARQIIRAARLDTHVVWQEEYHDHQLRAPERAWSTISYIHANPVRRGLCACAEDWPWSTADPQHRGWIEEEYLH